jgi:hypothetical protein
MPGAEVVDEAAKAYKNTHIDLKVEAFNSCVSLRLDKAMRPPPPPSSASTLCEEKADKSSNEPLLWGEPLPPLVTDQLVWHAIAGHYWDKQTVIDCDGQFVCQCHQV